MLDPRLEMRRLAGQVAMLLAFIHVLVLFAAAIGTAQGHGIVWWGWPLLSLPAIPFVPAVVAAVRLHRTADPERTRVLWRRSLLLAGIGSVLLVVAAVILGKTS